MVFCKSNNKSFPFHDWITVELSAQQVAMLNGVELSIGALYDESTVNNLFKINQYILEHL